MQPMPHLQRDRDKLIHRVRRIRGQVQAIEKALMAETECADMLQLVSACRGALNSLMGELIEGHIRFHVVNPDDNPTSARGRAAQELLDVLNTYLR
jgi:FrmR/RcnR family transcriptional regulator, repressor of frmRAB operon